MEDVPGALTALWELADDLGEESVIDPLHVLDPAGLLLVRPLERWDSDFTPVNSLTFALTGEDGTHFGLLQMPGFALSTAPVVMTVPDAYENQNLIVAENFDEFLNIGATAGWFTLERLASDPDGALEELSVPDLNPWSEREQLLTLMRDRLDIEPATLTLKRFEELQYRFGEAVVLDEDLAR